MLKLADVKKTDVVYDLGCGDGRDIREASVVTLFLLPDVNMRLRPKLLQELQPGTRIVSNTFDRG